MYMPTEVDEDSNVELLWSGVMHTCEDGQIMHFSLSDFSDPAKLGRLLDYIHFECSCHVTHMEPAIAQPEGCQAVSLFLKRCEISLITTCTEDCEV